MNTYGAYIHEALGKTQTYKKDNFICKEQSNHMPSPPMKYRKEGKNLQIVPISTPIDANQACSIIQLQNVND